MRIQPDGWPTLPKTAANKGSVGPKPSEGLLYKLHINSSAILKTTPTRFNQRKQQLIQSEIDALLMKGAIAKLRMLLVSGFHSTLFLAPKKTVPGGQ